MGILDRIQAAGQAFFSGRGGGNSTYPFKFVPAQTSRFNWHQEAGEVRATTVVATCLDFGMKCLQDVNFKIQRKNRDGSVDDIEDHPILDVLREPNPDNTCVDMLSRVYTDFMIEGTAFQYIARTRNGVPGELYWFDARYMSPCFPLTGSRFLTAWKYTPAGTGKSTDYPQEDVIVFRKGVDPVNDRLGISPVRVALKEIALTNLATSYTCGIMKNGGASTMVLMPVPGEEWTPDHARDMRISAQQRTSGDMAGTVLSFTTPVSMQGIGTTPGDLLLNDIDASAVARICASFGFSPMAVGYEDSNKTYANLEESIKSAWRHGIKPVIKSFVYGWNQRIMRELDPSGRTRIVADYSEVEALAQDHAELVTTASVAFKEGIWTQNEAREYTNKEPVDDGDIFKHEITAGGEDLEPEEDETGNDSGESPQEGREPEDDEEEAA